MALGIGGEATRRVPGVAEEVGGPENVCVAGPGTCRLAKDYERLPETALAMIYAAMSRIMLRRLACASC